MSSTKESSFNIISCNEIQHDAAYYIAHCLKGKFELEIVNIHGNSLRKFSNNHHYIWTKSTTKKLLYINLNSSGKINHKAAESLRQVIRDNPMLKVLDISSTQLQKSAVRPGLLCSKFYLLCLGAVLKKVAYYAQYYAHNYCNYAMVHTQFYHS